MFDLIYIRKTSTFQGFIICLLNEGPPPKNVTPVSLKEQHERFRVFSDLLY